MFLADNNQHFLKKSYVSQEKTKLHETHIHSTTSENSSNNLFLNGLQKLSTKITFNTKCTMKQYKQQTPNFGNEHSIV